MATHSSTLAWKIPWTEKPGRLQSMGSLRVGHDWATSLSLSCIGEGNGNPLQCSCLENPRVRGAWWAAVYGVTESWTRLKRLSSSSSNGVRCYSLSFFNSLKPALSLSSFTLIRRLFRSSSFSAIRVVSSAYLRLLMFLPPVLIPACNSSSLAFLMMCSAYRLNKQGDSRQPCLLLSQLWTKQVFPTGF